MGWQMQMAMAAVMAMVTAVLAAGGPATGPSSAPSPAPATVPTGEAVSAVATAFLDGKIDELEAGLASVKDAGLAPADKTQMTYIRQAVADDRGTWWKQIKAGKPASFRPVVWGRPIAATFDPAGKDGVVGTSSGGRMFFTVKWSVAEMDAKDEAEHGFSKGELADLQVWMTLGDADSWGIFGRDGLIAMSSDATKMPVLRYLDFRANLTGAHYSLPRSRRWGLWLCLASYLPKYAGSPTAFSRRAVALAFMSEVVSHAAAYPSLELPPGENNEEALAILLKDKIERKGWSVGEDKTIREALKALAMSNEFAAYKSGKIKLANGQSAALDPEQDKPLREKRDAWFKEHLPKLGKE